eukprot:764231-Hanusia_phi.AAC.7
MDTLSPCSITALPLDIYNFNPPSPSRPCTLLPFPFFSRSTLSSAVHFFVSLLSYLLTPTCPTLFPCSPFTILPVQRLPAMRSQETWLMDWRNRVGYYIMG